MRKLLSLGVFVVLLSHCTMHGEDVTVAKARPDGSVRLVVAVTTKAGHPVNDLREQDFTIFDGHEIRRRRDFKQVSVPDAPAGITAFVYELVFDWARSPGRREFHEVAVKVDRNDLRILTRQGYLTSVN